MEIHYSVYHVRLNNRKARLARTARDVRAAAEVERDDEDDENGADEEEEYEIAEIKKHEIGLYKEVSGYMSDVKRACECGILTTFLATLDPSACAFHPTARTKWPTLFPG